MKIESLSSFLFSMRTNILITFATFCWWFICIVNCTCISILYQHILFILFLCILYFFYLFILLLIVSMCSNVRYLYVLNVFYLFLFTSLLFCLASLFYSQIYFLYHILKFIFISTNWWRKYFVSLQNSRSNFTKFLNFILFTHQFLFESCVFLILEISRS
jgi:hypothetical protein